MLVSRAEKLVELMEKQVQESFYAFDTPMGAHRLIADAISGYELPGVDVESLKIEYNGLGFTYRIVDCIFTRDQFVEIYTVLFETVWSLRLLENVAAEGSG